MAWLTDAQIKAAAASFLSTVAGSLQSAVWDDRLARANAFAKNVITQFFDDLGLDIARAPDWNRAQEYQCDLALWFAGDEARAMFSEQGAAALDKKDRRVEMRALETIRVGDEILWPAAGDSDSVAVGSIATAAAVPPTCFRDTRRDPLIWP